MAMAQIYPRLDVNSRYGERSMDAKIVVMGNTGVGKTSLLQRYTQGRFDSSQITSTTGAFFVTKKVVVDGLKVRLQLWDTAGQERFRSMAPMYYRGANAALLLYDITNAKTFDDIRGWLQELRKNCPPELIIYIVGSKADLSGHRQVTSDLARLSLHKWFPPPKPPAPPPAPPPSTFSYIRPRFTSFASHRSLPTPPQKSSGSPEHSPLINGDTTLGPSLYRSNTGPGLSRPSSKAPGVNRANTTTTGIQSRSPPNRGSYLIGQAVGYNDVVIETSSNSLNEDDEDPDTNDQEWGLHKGMELFEVSSKDDFGIDSLFGALISSIITKKEVIDRENELRKRDSVFLSSVSQPAWANREDEVDVPIKKKSTGPWSCCAS